MENTVLGQHCMTKPGAVYDYKVEWEAGRFMVGGKLFAMMGGDKEGRSILSVKAEPQMGEILRQQYPDQIVPGYYMNKVHWNSAYLQSDLPVQLLQQMIDESYRLIFESLSKKLQREIGGQQQAE